MEPTDHFIMWAFLIVIVASEAANTNSNLCYKTVEEDYTEIVPYGKNITNLFQNLNLSVPLFKVHKTKTINKYDCCDGFERQNEKDEKSPCLRSQDPNSEIKKMKVPINFKNHSKTIIGALQKYNITLPKYTGRVYRTVKLRVCRQGYEKETETDRCKPKISENQKDQEESCNCGPNSKCIAPYTCQCDEGFYSKKGVCVREPEMTDEEIENQIDVLLSNSCDSDENEGIDWDDNDHKNEDENEHKNEHKIEDEKENGNEYVLEHKNEGDDKHVQVACRKANKPTCCDGYENKAGKCTPICSPECGPNSYCQKANTCQCKKGYKRGSSGLCLSDSSDFRIDDPHVCPVGSSSLLIEKLRPTQFSCCKGYKQVSKGSPCQPICHAGFVLSENNLCTPISIPKNDEIAGFPGGPRRTEAVFRNGFIKSL